MSKVVMTADIVGTRPKQWRLPLELEYEIISNIHDTETLRSCSLTRRSWYHITKPRLHYSLTVRGRSAKREKEWPKPLQKKYELKLLGFVKCLKITDMRGFTFKHLRGGNFQYFEALKNLQALRIDGIELSGFIHHIPWCLGHFKQVNTLFLHVPSGSCRQLLYFMGCFPALRDFMLTRFSSNEKDESEDSLKLVPQCTPPIERLTLEGCRADTLVNAIISVYRPLRVRSMHLSCVSRAQPLLEAYAKTLETLELSPPRLYAGPDHCALDFSQLKFKSLQTLELLPHPDILYFLKIVLPAISSPHPPNILLGYPGLKTICDLPFRRRLLCEIQKKWSFQLVLCAEVPTQTAGECLRALEGIVDAQQYANTDPELYSFLSKTLIVSRIPPLFSVDQTHYS